MANEKQLIKEIKMAAKSVKPTYTDVGTCLRFKGEAQIFRSKFKTESDATDEMNKLKSIGVTNPIYVTYKCPECSRWHFGLKEWGE